MALATSEESQHMLDHASHSTEHMELHVLMLEAAQAVVSKTRNAYVPREIVDDDIELPKIQSGLLRRARAAWKVCKLLHPL